MVRRIFPLLLLLACTSEKTPTQSSCVDGKRICSSGMVRVCTDGKYTTETDCTKSSKTCELVGGDPQCVVSTNCTTQQEGNTRCNEAGTWTQECSSSKWSDSSNCTAQGMECVQTGLTTAECKAPPPCTPGATRCKSNLLQTCTGGLFNVGTDCGDKTCVTVNENTAQCSYCTQPSGSYNVCAGDELITCNGNSQDGSGANCANLTGSNPVDGTCYSSSGAAACVFNPSQPCAYSDSSGQTYVFACGSSGVPSSSYGCDMIAGCTTNLGTCTPPTSGTYQAQCRGNNLVVDCLETFPGTFQPYGVDCTRIVNANDTCDSTAKVCRRSSAGGQCYPGILECMAGQTCNNGTCS